MTQVSDRNIAAVFQPNPDEPPRALLVAGACGNVGFGKLGQFARLLSKHGVPVVALDLSPKVQDVKDNLAKQFGKKFSEDQVAAILEGITVVQGTLDDVPEALKLGFVFEAIPERLDIKRPFYEAIRKRDPEAYVFSATSGITTQKLFSGLPGAERSGVLHPFFPHLTNKLWELPSAGDPTTSADTLKTIRKLFGSFGMNLVEVSDVPAFAADRLFCGMMLEAVRIENDTDLTPAQIDDACRKLMGTSPFLVHNMIPGANYLSAHCMELMQEEVDSTLYAIPDSWGPYVEDPKRQWPYERGQKCPPESLPMVRERMLGMLFSLSAYMLEHGIARHDQLNFLGENALAFRQGTPALIADMGLSEARALTEAFLKSREITHPEKVAPLAAFDADREGWGQIYVDTAVHGDVGLLSLKRTTLNHVFVAQLDAAYEKLAANDGVKAIVLAPDGALSREFGHGADPNCFVPVLGKEDAALGLIETWKATFNKLRSGKPTVAALVGRVLGGGNELASACHARIAAEGTRIGQPEPIVGVVPGLGGCNHIHRFSKPEAHARISELLLTGHAFKADEAAEWGYVSKLVPVRDLPRESMAFASALASGETAIPEFFEGGREVPVSKDVATTNEAGIPHDRDLRDLIADTVAKANAVPYAEGTKIEAVAAAKSLTMSSTAIGVKAMLRGKPPQFENPL